MAEIADQVDKIVSSLKWCKSGDIVDRYYIINNMVQSRGFNLIGQGNFSDFYTHKDFEGIGFKIGTKKEDSASAYIAWCRQNQHRAGVPKVYDIQRQEKNGMYVVAMKLYDNYTKKWTTGQYELWNHIHQLVTMLSTPKYTELRIVARMARRNDQSFYEINKKFIFDYMRTMLEIRKFFIGIAQFDIHDGNYVLDENMLPVIIDPISFQLEEKTIRYDHDDKMDALANVGIHLGRNRKQKNKLVRGLCI